MKRITAYLTMIFALACCVQVQAQEAGDPGEAFVDGKLIWSQTKTSAEDPIYQNFKNRKAMAGKGYAVNKLVQVVSVGAWVEDLNDLTDEDLDNYATFPSIVGAGIGATPIVSVRDINNYYDKGTKAGFCVVVSSGENVLSLDVIEAMTIQFYRDGVKLGDPVAVKEGVGASGVGLSLIKIPGSEDACTYLEVEAPYVFDEICLIKGGGVNLDVGGSVKIKYAYVGEPVETKITTNGVKTYAENNGRKYDYDMEGWNAVLLGLPFGFIDSEVEKMTNDDYDDYATITPILSVGYQGGAKFTVKPTDGKGEMFKAGSEVGFKYYNANAVNLGIGSTVTIVLFDKDGDKIDEQTISSGVLSLSVAGGNVGIASIVADKDFSGAELRFYTGISVNLGAMGVYYGFVREKADVNHRCPINPTVSTNVCDEQSSYQLAANPDLSVEWTLVDQPEGANANVTSSGKVTNMNKQGAYVFRATCLSCPAEEKCYEEITLNVGDAFVEMAPEQVGGKPLVNTEDNPDKYAASDKIHETSGALVSISDLKNSENLVTESTDDYARYTGGLGVASNLWIAGVKSNDGSLLYDGDQHQGEQFKVGFVVENDTEGLNVGLLQFFQIRLYYKGEKVAEGVITESNTVSVGLAGGSNGEKMRYCAIFDAVKDGQAIQFDEVTLWNSGVLNLQLDEISIYYAFIQEDYNPDTDIDNPLACITTHVSVNETNASLNGDAMQMAAAVAVGGVIDGVSNFIDGDIETPMQVVNTVGAGTGSIIAVNMGRTLDFRHQLCIVLDNNTYVAGVNVGSWMKVTTYLRGQKTNDEFTGWNALGVNAIGYGDKSIIILQPKSTYDEVRLEIAGVVGVLDFQNFYGLYLRGDIDNDGIPDCMDTDNCSTTIEGIEATDICEGDMITISGKGLGKTEYTIQLPDQGIDETFTTDQHGYFSHTFQLNRTGRYTMTFRDGSGTMMGSAPYTVHPLVTTWRTDAASTDWNEWNNWTDGSPYCCTDAVIPQGATRYPVLDGTVTEGDEYCVQGIHFEPGAAVDRVYKLNYDSAWVEMELEPNRYYMLAAPLKHTYTGDMFIPAAGTAMPAYFTKLTEINLPENRFDPRIYQRLWAQAAPYRGLEGPGETTEVGEARWTRNFNALAFDYSSSANGEKKGYSNAFSLWVDNGNLPETQKFRFRFPKEHGTYYYYEDFPEPKITDKSETLDRCDDANNGAKTEIYRFVYEGESEDNKTFGYERLKPGENAGEPASTTDTRTVYLGSAEYKAKLDLDPTIGTGKSEGYFAAANPFMSRIDVAKFLAANSEVISEVKFYDGNTISSATLADGGLVSTQAGAETVQPMQGFFVKAKDADATELEVTFSGDMMSPDVAEAAAKTEDETAQEAEAADMLRMTVRRGETEASAIVTTSTYAEAKTLIDNEVSPKVAVFTVADGTAYDIHPSDGRAYIPVGILTSAADTLTFSFETAGNADLADYELYDNVTGTAYPLDNELTFSNMGTSVGRFALRDRRASSSLEDGMAASIYVAVQDGRAIIRSSQPDIMKVEVYTAGGVKTGGLTSKGTVEAAVNIDKGVNIVRVTLESGEVKTFKVM